MGGRHRPTPGKLLVGTVLLVAIAVALAGVVAIMAVVRLQRGATTDV